LLEKCKAKKEGKHCGNTVKYAKGEGREETLSTTVPGAGTPEMLDIQ
jgi:hypothetical protein